MSTIKRSAESRPYRGFLSQKLQMWEGCLQLARVLQYCLLKPFRVYRSSRQTESLALTPSDPTPPCLGECGREGAREVYARARLLGKA